MLNILKIFIKFKYIFKKDTFPKKLALTLFGPLFGPGYSEQGQWGLKREIVGWRDIQVVDCFGY